MTQLAKLQWTQWANNPEASWAEVQEEQRRYEPVQVKDQLGTWLADYGSFPKRPRNAGSWSIKRDSEFGLAGYATGRRIDVIVDGILTSTIDDATKAAVTIPIDYKPGENTSVIIKLYRGRSWWMLR